MSTVIVPVDFSETSIHAATYAAYVLQNQYGITMLLYHSYSDEAEGAEAEQTMLQMKQKLREKFFVNIEILAVKEDDFVAGLERAVRHRVASSVIMGITGRSAIGQVFMGSNTLKFAETKACPVIIVPQHAAFREVKNVMMACDFKDSFHTIPSVPIKDFLRNFRPQLHVVNVDPNHYIQISDDYEREKQVLKGMFAEYNPEFYFLRLYDIDEAINLFAEERNIDLIITVQRNHTFRDKLFKRSRTKSLTYHSNVPIMVVHE